MPVVIALVAIIALIGIANISSLLRGNKKTAPPSTMPTRPSAPDARQVTDFETQQQLQARHDAEDRQRQQELVAAMEQLQDAQDVPEPEAAQRAAIYGDDPNAPARTSEATQAQAEAKQKALAREKQQQDAINSDTVAIDFEHPNNPTSSAVAPQTTTPEAAQKIVVDGAGGVPPALQRSDAKTNPMKASSIAFTKERFLRESSPTTSTAVSAGRS